MIPSVNLTQLDRGLGIMPPSVGDIAAVIGCSTSGTAALPAAYTRVEDLKTAFGRGPLVEAAAMIIEITGKPVVAVKAATTTQGGYGTLVDDGVTGTSVVTTTADTHPIDEYDVVVVIVKGGTVGTGGITYKWSLNGGRSFSPVTALGTANTIAITDDGVATGVSFSLGAGTLVANDTWSVPTTAPIWDATSLLAATTALKNNAALVWDYAHIVGDAVGADLTAIDTWMQGLFSAGKYRYALMGFRRPTASETEAQYLAAFVAAFGSLSSTFVGVSMGYAKTRSSVSSRMYKRPASWVASVRAAQVYLGQDMAEVDMGSLPGVRLTDDNGNPDDHDEAISPGGDDARAITLRTVEGYEGTYVTNPRLLAPAGSDFIYVQFRSVMNRACAIVKQELTRRLSKAIRLNKKTGLILESEAKDIESVVNAKLRAALLSKPSCSEVKFVLKRDDNVLSTQTLTGDVRITPLAYPKKIEVTLGFNNPALRIAA